MEGTFSLSKAQLDRFLMKLKLGYPTQKEEEQMLEQVGDEMPYEKIEHIFNPGDIKALQKHCKDIHVHSNIREYIAMLANSTRNHPVIIPLLL